MSVTDKGPKYDFSDVSKTDSQKWKLFSKDLSHHVMNTHGPLGSLTDPRTITLIEDSPGDDLWGLTKRQPFSEKFTQELRRVLLLSRHMVQGTDVGLHHSGLLFPRV